MTSKPPAPDTAAVPGGSAAFSRALARALDGPLGLAKRPAVTLAAGATLLQAGEVPLKLAFLIEGRVDAVLQAQSGDGAQVVPLAFAAGEIVLLSQLFCAGPGFVDLVAGTRVKLRWVPVAEIEAALAADAPALLLLTRFLAQRLREVQLRERAWVERGVHERVCAALSRLAAEQPRRSDGRWLIHATHEQVAQRCGASRPKTSLALKRLEQAGRVRLERGAIELLDPASLAAGLR